MAAQTLRRSSLPIASLLLIYASCSGQAGMETGGGLGTGGTGASGGTQSSMAGLSGSGGGSDAAGGSAGMGKPPPVSDVGDGGTPLECAPTTCASSNSPAAIGRRLRHDDQLRGRGPEVRPARDLPRRRRRADRVRFRPRWRTVRPVLGRGGLHRRRAADASVGTRGDAGP